MLRPAQSGHRERKQPLLLDGPATRRRGKQPLRDAHAPRRRRKQHLLLLVNRSLLGRWLKNDALLLLHPRLLAPLGHRGVLLL